MKNTGDSAIAALFSLLGIYVLLEARKLDSASGYGVGAGFFPFWLGVSLALLGAIVLWRTLRADPPAAAFPPHTARKRLLVMAALLAFVPAAGACGFIVAFTLLVALLLFVVEGEAWWRALVISVLAGVAFHFLFVRLLEVELPLGPWNF